MVLVAVLVVAIFGSNYGWFAGAGFIVHTVALALLLVTTFFIVVKSAATVKKSSFEAAELQDTFFKIEDALVVYDNDFKVQMFNPAAEALFRVAAASVVGHRFQPQDIESPTLRILAQIVFPSLAPMVVNYSKAGESPQVAELSFAEPILNLRISTYVVSDEKGKQVGFMKIMRDKTRETALVKSKTEFLTTASHQLRTPVTELNWALESLVGDQTIGESPKIILQNALGSAQKLKKIVEDLLNIARIEEGRFGYAFKDEDIVAVVGSLLTEVAPLARKAGIKLYFDHPKSPTPKVSIDAAKLSAAISNVLENAIRYNVENGEVVVRIEEQKDKPYVEVMISDTGIGIPQEAMGRLFTKFFRAENVLKVQADGSGLGLYIAKNIIQAHGGRIWAESELGRGTVFRITIPTDPNLIPKHEVAME